MPLAVSEIQCTFSGIGDGKNRDSIAAKLRKPEGFRGSPLFADDRNADPLSDASCQIRPDHTDATELTYNLLITDFSRCGVLKRNVSNFQQTVYFDRKVAQQMNLLLGFCSRSNLVPAIPRCCHDVRSRTYFNV